MLGEELLVAEQGADNYCTGHGVDVGVGSQGQIPGAKAISARITTSDHDDKKKLRKKWFGKQARDANLSSYRISNTDAAVEAGAVLVQGPEIVRNITLGSLATSVLSSSSQPEGRPLLAAATLGNPVALVLLVLLLRAFWYYHKHRSKVLDEGQQERQQKSSATAGCSQREAADEQSDREEEEEELSEDENPTACGDGAREIRETLVREAQAKQSIVIENEFLQKSLATHKTTVEKFQTELQSRNERLTVFEQEQESVRRDLSAQIDVLKRELQERQSQEQGNLKSKEQLCNDLISKIKTLNTDLENHERLWQGVAEKAQQKESESVAKVESLQSTLRQEEAKRTKELALKEEERAKLLAKVQTLEGMQEQQASPKNALDHYVTTRETGEADFQKRLAKEQEHTSNLASKLQVFSSELASRQDKASNLNEKMRQVQVLSVKELDQLQQDLKVQIRQRVTLQEKAQEMTHLLEEKQDQCGQLSSRLESSQGELKALEDRLALLTNDVEKRRVAAAARVEAMQAHLENDRKDGEECREVAGATGDELKKKQEEFVQLTTRMDLYLKELQFRDEQVASLETKMAAKEELATTEIKTLRNQLQVLQERRDEWNKTTTTLEQMLRGKKAQVVGLTTRAELFERELQERQAGVATLESKLRELQEGEAMKMAPLRNELCRLESERDAWKEITDEILRLLHQKKAQIPGIKTRLQLFKAQLAERDQRVAKIKSSFEEKRNGVMTAMAPGREKLELQRLQRNYWVSKTEEINRLLNQKRGQIVGLTTRVSLFKQELKIKDEIVVQLEKKLADKKNARELTTAPLKKQLEEQTTGRDEWRTSTEQVQNLLIERKKKSAELTTEVKRLVYDLQSYQQRRARLESLVEAKKPYYENRRINIEEDRKAIEQHRDEWIVKIKELARTQNSLQAAILALQTRVSLFEKELEQRREAVQSFEDIFVEMEEKSSFKLQLLRDEIDAGKREHEAAVEQTLHLNKEAKTTKRQCIGLTTRMKLFSRELEKRQTLVSEQEAKIDCTEQGFAATLERLGLARKEQAEKRDQWKQKTEDIERLFNRTEGELVGLGTRLELFMNQVMEHEENVSRAESKLNTKRGLSNPSYAKEYGAAKEKRDEWTSKALEIQRLLNMKKAQIPGLQTRGSLFRKELGRLEEQVVALDKKIAEKTSLAAAKIAPFRKALIGYAKQRDEWKTNVEKINQSLNEKQEECLPISARLEGAIDCVTKCKERTESLEKELADEQHFATNTVAKKKQSLERQKAELRQWEESTNKVRLLLHEKQQGTHGLKTRMKIFGDELKKREAAFSGVQAQIDENDKMMRDELDRIHFQIDAEHKGRDRIIETTLGTNQTLKATEDICQTVTVRCKLFEDELRNREERFTMLEAKLQEKEYNYRVQLTSLVDELAAKRSDRDKWRDNTLAMDRLLRDTRGECMGLDTRLKLFLVEKKNYDEQLAASEAEVIGRESDSVQIIAPLQSKLKQEQEERDSWDRKTSDLNRLLQSSKGEILGLTTRSKLFKKELSQKDQGVATLSAEVRNDEEDFAARMKPLLKEHHTRKAERDQWAVSTSKVVNLLKQTKTECMSIPTRLDLFRREQNTREEAVFALDGKVKNMEDLVAVQLGFMLNELQLQQKQRGKWKKVTLEMHRLLKETKEQVASLTGQLAMSQNTLGERQERVRTLETQLRDGRDLVAQQLKALNKEVAYQRDRRDKLNESCVNLSRCLEEGKALCSDLSQKLEESVSKVQGCTTEIRKLEAKVDEKKKLDGAQIESLTEQLKVHAEQRAEWQRNTDQVNQELKEKRNLCLNFNAKLTLLKQLQNGGEIRSMFARKADDNNPSGQSGLSAHCNELAANDAQGKKLEAKMDSLEKALRTQQKPPSDLDSKLEGLASELLNL